jgi:hypothetical protein
MKKIIISLSILAVFALAVYAASPDQATVADTVTISSTFTVTNLTPLLIAPARTDRVSVKIQHLSGGENVGYAFTTNSFTTSVNGYGTIAAGASSLFDNVQGPVVPQTAIYAMAAATNANVVRVTEFRRTK